MRATTVSTSSQTNSILTYDALASATMPAAGQVNLISGTPWSRDSALDNFGTTMDLWLLQGMRDEPYHAILTLEAKGHHHAGHDTEEEGDEAASSANATQGSWKGDKSLAC